MKLRYLPNILTISRLLLIIPFLMCLYRSHYVNAFYLFLLAGFTDGLDGFLARHYHWQTFFGSFIDPLADKLLIASSFISLALMGKLPWWLVILVFLRDITISFGVLAWYRFVQKKLDFHPTYISKLNTFFQLVLVTTCLFELAFFDFPLKLQQALIILTAITTACTYVDYVWTWGKEACSKIQISK